MTLHCDSKYNPSLIQSMWTLKKNNFRREMSHHLFIQIRCSACNIFSIQFSFSVAENRNVFECTRHERRMHLLNTLGRVFIVNSAKNTFVRVRFLRLSAVLNCFLFSRLFVWFFLSDGFFSSGRFCPLHLVSFCFRGSCQNTHFSKEKCNLICARVCCVSQIFRRVSK